MFLCKSLIRSLCERRWHKNLWGTDSFPMCANKGKPVAFLFLPPLKKNRGYEQCNLPFPKFTSQLEILPAYSIYAAPPNSMPNDMLACHNVVWKGVLPCSWVSMSPFLIGGCDRRLCHGAALWWCVHLDWLLTQGTIKRALHYNIRCFNWLPIYPLCVVQCSKVPQYV